MGYKNPNPVTKKIELPEEVQLDEKCWKGYEKKGMKTMFGKRYPNCVKKKKTRKEEVELDEKKDQQIGYEKRVTVWFLIVKRSRTLRGTFKRPRWCW